MLFANEAEITSLYQVDDFDDALRRVHDHCEIAALTRQREGAVIVTRDEVHVVAAAPGRAVVDTTGAGDLFAAGFLFGLTHGYDLGTTGRLGALAASEVITHLGPRPRCALASWRAPLAIERTPPHVSSPRYRTGNEAIDQKVARRSWTEVADPPNADLVFEMVASALRLGERGADPRRPQDRQRRVKGDAPRVRRVRRTARPARWPSSVPARTQPDNPLYVQTRESRRRDRRPSTGWWSPGPGPGSWRPGSRARARPTRSA